MADRNEKPGAAWDYGEIRRADRWSRWNTALDGQARQKNLDKFRGCLVGGAAGDALGYAVEFSSEELIRARFGPAGIQAYVYADGAARISDDTQMTLFTANGLLFGTTRGCLRGIQGPYPSYVAEAYREWYKTQTSDYPAATRFQTSWLLNVPALYARRAPGNTCLAALEEGGDGSIEHPINHSKGCGGVMRVAPVGLYFGESRLAGLAADLMAADVAALTHGHPLGYMPAALLAHVVRLVSHSDAVSLEAAVLDALEAVKRIFPGEAALPEFLSRMEQAVALARGAEEDLAAIHALGAGWCGDEALAVAVYCALRHQDDFDAALRAAVNHGGDSDSTGAITGNILGAYLGLSAIPAQYLQRLELLDVILELADDLYYDCRLDEYTVATDPRDLTWERKYVDVTYPG